MRLNKISFLFPVFITMGMMFIGNAFAETKYSILDLGPGTAFDINNKGQVVGYSNSNVYIWEKDKGFIVIGGLGGNSCHGEAINDLGQVVGYSMLSDGSTHTFYWDPVSLTKDLFTGMAFDINDQGQIVGIANTLDNKTHAFISDKNGFKLDLGTLGGNTSNAIAINSFGRIAGFADTSDGSSHATSWDSAYNILQKGVNNSFAYDLNDSSMIVGSQNINSVTHAYAWTGDGLQKDLGTLGNFSSDAEGINNINQIVGNLRLSGQLSSAFIWDAEHGMRDLNTLIDPNTGWQIQGAWAINDAGYIVGVGSKGGTSGGILMIPQVTGQLPLANAGQDIVSPENVKIVLNGSNSTDPDGTIIKYIWSRLPDNKILCESTEPTCETFTLGRAGEFIELTVVDNDYNLGKDSLSIYHKMPAVCGNGNIEDTEICDGNSMSCLTSVGGYAGTKYCNGQCTAFGNCLSGLSCGDHIKNGTELCDGNSQACTTAGGYAGNQSCNAQCSGFNTCVTTLSCGDGICSAPPETNLTCSQDCTAKFNTTLEAESMPTKTAGGAMTGGWSLWSNGYIQQPVNFPRTAVYQFKITAKGTVAQGVWPNMQLRIDQVSKSNTTVGSGTWTVYTVSTTVTQGTHNVAIAYTNDLNAPPEDRNLLVDKITIIEQ